MDEAEVDAAGEEFPGTAVAQRGQSRRSTRTRCSASLMPAGAPVMRLTGAVLLTKALRAGEGVSYGYTHRARPQTPEWHS